ncbi:MAG: response regulator transcription factor [Candidatus Melainabacteria bacterium]|nr:response regulator transcription factor [Candidatus Melainabacteria bacterium]
MVNPKILVVDDEQDLVRLVRYNLEHEGFTVLYAYDGSSALDLVWNKRPDLVILDLMLPDTPGLRLCQQIKQAQGLDKVPAILMLTARSAEQDRIAGFEHGADDYVTKPFSPRELVLRVKAMLGRSGSTPPPIIHIGPIRIVPEEYRVFIAEEEVRLTPIEYRILLTLARHPNVVRTREQLLVDVWEESATEVLDRTVDAHVKRLRAKLGIARDSLETVRGIGYRLLTNRLPHAANASQSA